ncbi:MAG: hypothetical protein WCF85_20960 [Rhodospirillaceae bacterium]
MDTDPQPGLFTDLPTTEPRRRRTRRSPAAAPAVLSIPPEFQQAEFQQPRFQQAEAAAAPVALPPAPPVFAAGPVRVDAAALTNPELAELVRDLSDGSLAYLLIATVRDATRRLSPDEREDEAEDRDNAGGAEPHPALMRAVKTVLSELTGDI